jgi:hypothetical protein
MARTYFLHEDFVALLDVLDLDFEFVVVLFLFLPALLSRFAVLLEPI